MKKLRVPEAYRAGFEKFLNLDEPQISELFKAVLSTKPTAPGSKFIGTASKKVKNIERADSREILSALIGLHAGRMYAEMPVKEFAKELSEGTRESDRESEPEDLTSLIERMLQLEPLTITAKANDVRGEQEHALCVARIMTDMRPIFKESSADEIASFPSAAVILHTLKIRYHEGDDIKEFFVAMDADDLSNLQEMISRAESKEKSLRDVLTKAGVQCLDTGS